MQNLSMEIRMTTSTKYCATAIICTLILATAYMLINRYEHAGYLIFQRDNWTGKVYTEDPHPDLDHDAPAKLIQIDYDPFANETH